MTNYNELFMRAVADSKALELFFDDIVLKEKTYIAEWLMFELGPKIGATFTQEQFINFLTKPQNAIRLHHFFKPIIDELLNVDCIITSGYVKVANDAGEEETFGTTTLDAYKEALKVGEVPEKIHSWITLPSGEIIDLAFMTIYGILYHEESLYGNLVAKKATELTGGMEYHPIIVGETFFEQCNFGFKFTAEAFSTESLNEASK